MKLKWNWGTKLMAAMVFFMGLLVVLVIRSTSEGIMLVEKDYYPKGLKYQERLDEIENARPFTAQVRIYQQVAHVVVDLPSVRSDTGSIVFFRPSDNRLDRAYILGTDTLTSLSFPKSSFQKGRYLVKIYWKKEGKGYYIEKPFYFN